MYELDPSASIVVTIVSAVYPELFRFVTLGLLLEPSTSDNILEARRALSHMSRLLKVFSLFDTLYFFAISVLVCTILQYLDILTLRSIVTVDGAFSLSLNDLLWNQMSSLISLQLMAHLNSSLNRLLCHFGGREFHRLVKFSSFMTFHFGGGVTAPSYSALQPSV